MTSFDPDFFEREEITAIGGEFGPLGELAAIRLLCEVCRRGYYMPWDTIRKMSIIGKIPGLTPDMLDAIVARMAEYGIFSRRRLRDTDPVLTSADLQRRHIRRIGLARARRITSWPHLLIDLTAEFGIIPATVSGDSEPFDTPLPVDTRLPRRMQPYLKIRLTPVSTSTVAYATPTIVPASRHKRRRHTGPAILICLFMVIRDFILNFVTHKYIYS